MSESVVASGDAPLSAGRAESTGSAQPTFAAAREGGQLESSRDLPIGGQAVLEGVMMRGVTTWAVAVRLPEDHPSNPNGIVVEQAPFESVLARHKWMRLPIVRGSVALVESMGIGMKALGISANAQAGDEDEEPLSGLAWFGTVAVSLLFAVGFFFLLPAALTRIVGGNALHNGILFVFVERCVHVALFLLYLVIISRLPDLQRVFQYHGAEHKSIACREAGLPLEPEQAQRFSRLHPRCGTSFLLIVAVVAFFVFVPFGRLPLGWLLISRVVGFPLVTGLAFEAIKFLGAHRQAGWARVLIWPGMQLQRLTTREPSLPQLAVALAALQAVLDNEDPEKATAAQKIGIEVTA